MSLLTFSLKKLVFYLIYIKSPFFKVSFKQFVVTNYSKERPGSIVTETLKNGIEF